MTICATPELSSLDTQLTSTYKNVLQNRVGDADLIKKGQRLWLKEIRNKATSGQEIREAYLARINDLNAMLNLGGASATSAGDRETPAGAQTAPQPAQARSPSVAVPVATPAAPQQQNTETLFESRQLTRAKSIDSSIKYDQSIEIEYCYLVQKNMDNPEYRESYAFQTSSTPADFQANYGSFLTRLRESAVQQGILIPYSQLQATKLYDFLYRSNIATTPAQMEIANSISTPSVMAEMKAMAAKRVRACIALTQ